MSTVIGEQRRRLLGRDMLLQYFQLLVPDALAD
jgi:hypothetical protein